MKNIIEKLNNKDLLKKLSFLPFILVLLYFFYECPMEHVIGISCPGCGMTRALISFIKLDFKMAFHYHPLFPLVIILAIGYLIDLFKIVQFNKKVKNIILWISLAAFIIVYLIRMFSGSDIVNVHFEKSLLHDIFSKLTA